MDQDYVFGGENALPFFCDDGDGAVSEVLAGGVVPAAPPASCDELRATLRRALDRYVDEEQRCMRIGDVVREHALRAPGITTATPDAAKKLATRMFFDMGSYHARMQNVDVATQEAARPYFELMSAEHGAVPYFAAADPILSGVSPRERADGETVVQWCARVSAADVFADVARYTFAGGDGSECAACVICKATLTCVVLHEACPARTDDDDDADPPCTCPKNPHPVCQACWEAATAAEWTRSFTACVNERRTEPCCAVPCPVSTCKGRVCPYDVHCVMFLDWGVIADAEPPPVACADDGAGEPAAGALPLDADDAAAPPADFGAGVDDDLAVLALGGACGEDREWRELAHRALVGALQRQYQLIATIQETLFARTRERSERERLFPDKKLRRCTFCNHAGHYANSCPWKKLAERRNEVAALERAFIGACADV